MLAKCPQACGVGPHDDLCQTTAIAGVHAGYMAAAGQAEVID